MRITPISKGVGVGVDRNNCTVRALANATGMDYDKLHTEMKTFGRKDGKGCRIDVWLPVYKMFGGSVRGIFGTTNAARYFAKMTKNEYPRKEGTTLKTILPKLTGKHICLIQGHAFAVINGQVIDSFGIEAGSRITMVIDF